MLSMVSLLSSQSSLQLPLLFCRQVVKLLTHECNEIHSIIHNLLFILLVLKPDLSNLVFVDHSHLLQLLVRFLDLLVLFFEKLLV